MNDVAIAVVICSMFVAIAYIVATTVNICHKRTEDRKRETGARY